MMAVTPHVIKSMLVLLAVYLPVLALAIAYIAQSKRSARLGMAVAMVVAYAASYLLSLYQAYLGMGLPVYALFAAPIAALFAMAVASYFNKHPAFYIFIALSALIIAASVYDGAPIAMLMQAFSVGTIAGIAILLHRGAGRGHNLRSNDKKVEINRDIFQICCGVALLLVLLASFSIGKYVVFAIVLLGYLAISYFPRMKGGKNALINALLSMERPRTIFGFGALYLAAGAFLVISLIPDFRLMMFGLVALFIADSLATIFGLHMRSPRLPYNRGKSAAGSLIYFAALAIFGMLFVGYYAVVLAAILAFVEGLSSRIDDNVSVSSALVLISALLML